MSQKYDLLAEVSRRFQQTHVQQNGETPAQTIARMERNQALRDKFASYGALKKRLSQNDIRVDKVAEIRGQLLAGTYEDNDKLDVAIGRLLDELVA